MKKGYFRRALLLLTTLSIVNVFGPAQGAPTSKAASGQVATPAAKTASPAVPTAAEPREAPTSPASPKTDPTPATNKMQLPATTREPATESVAGPVDLSPLERSLSQGTKGAAVSAPQPYQAPVLTQFGYSFFRPTSTDFAALTDVPVGPDYVVGPGDHIVLNLWGTIEGTHELEINRSGEIVLPRVGSLKVWGISFQRLPEVIKTALSRVVRDFELNVTLGKLRTVKVYLVGEVAHPGGYNIGSLSTVLNALGAAGGPLKTGTLRKIQVKRGGRVVETVDLYDFFLKGDKSRDLRLQSGDTIFVPVIGPVAGIAGNVKRPAIYELKDEKTLADLIGLAEGLLPTGYLQRLQIARVMAHEKNVVADFNIEPQEATQSLEQISGSIAIQDMDVATVFPIDATLRGHVRLEGYVLRPGDYALKPGMKLSMLLLPDNLLPEYYRDAVRITRLHPPDYHPEVFFVDLTTGTGGNPANDPELREFDRVKVFSRWEMEERPTVRVNGEVQRPGEFLFFEHMTVRDLIREAGNLRITAYTRDAEINRLTRTGEQAKSFPIMINLAEAMQGNPAHDLPLSPLDELTVRKIPNWADEKERYVSIQGEVRFPGVYPIYKGERMSALIERAGGFTEKAYLRGSKFTRRSVQEEQQKRMEEVIAATEKNIVRKQGELSLVASSKEDLEATRLALDGLLRSLEKLKLAKAEGRLEIRLAPLEQFRQSRYDLELMGGDTLQIPKMPNYVTVLGQVYNPATLLHTPGKGAGYYLHKAGGPNSDAEEAEIYIVQATGTVVARQQTSFGFRWDDERDTWRFGPFLSTELQPGDALVVPQKLERIAWMREIKDISTILAQIALTAGVMLAAGL